MESKSFVIQHDNISLSNNTSVEATYENSCPDAILKEWKRHWELHDMFSWGFEGIGLVFVACYGTLLNSIAISILRTKNVASYFSLLLVWLAIFDIVFLLSSTLYHIPAVQPYILHYYVYASLFVYVISPMRSIVMCCSIYMTVVLSLDRYRAVSNPTEYHVQARLATSKSWLTNRYLMKRVGPVIAVSFCFYVPKFFDLQITELSQVCITQDGEKNSTESNIHCTLPQYVIEGTKLRNNDKFVLWYVNVANFIITVAIPLISLIYLNVCTYCKVLVFLRRQPPRASLEVSKAVKERSKDIQQAYQLFAMVFLFVLCHAIRVSLNIEEFINMRGDHEEKQKSECAPPSVWSKAILPPISHFLLQFNSSANFFVYCFLNNTFRNVIKDRYVTILKYCRAPTLLYYFLNGNEPTNCVSGRNPKCCQKDNGNNFEMKPMKPINETSATVILSPANRNTDNSCVIKMI